MPYVPLHVHSVYSGASSLLTFADIASRASFLGYHAVGLTDHWSTFGHFEFYEAARRAGIKPVFGSELQHVSFTGASGQYHLTVLAENEVGYRNLCSLVSLHSSRQRSGCVTADDLAAHREGLIVLTGCMRGEVSQAVMHGTLGRARDVIMKLVEIFGPGNVFIELMNHNTQEEALVADQLAVLSDKANVPAVVTNNDRYALKEDAEYCRIACLIGKKRGEETPAAAAEEYYLKRERELRPLFGVGQDAFDRSGEIADRCTVDLSRTGQVVFSSFPIPQESLADQCRRRFKLAFHNRPPDERRHLSRLVEREIASARAEGVAGFLLFLRDVFSAAAGRGIWVEIMGGALIESIVAHLLEIVPLNPAEHDLVFESFSSSRPAAPPIEVITSEARKEDLVGIIADLLPGYSLSYQMTHEEMSLVTIAKEVAEILAAPAELRAELARVRAFDRRSKTLAALLEASPEARHLYTNEPLAKSVFHAAYALQGKLLHATLDSSRILVLPRELDGFVSYVDGPASDRFGQIGSEAVESHGGWMAGIQHSHFLSAIAETVNSLRSTPGEGAQLAAAAAGDGKRWLPPSLDDPHVYALVSSGETEGVYLLESQGIRDHLMRIKPDSFGELVNVISLYRPGPMEGRLWERYLENAEKKGKVFLPHATLASFLAGTRGVLLYQEQVREIIEEVAGLRGADAVAVERALRERDSGELVPARLSFMRGAMDAGTNEEDAQRIFDFLLHTIAFTHSKALSCAQASVTYRTAFLKAHAFERYFTALLNSNLGVKEREKRYLEYVRSSGVPVLPYGINADAVAFSCEDGVIRAPLAALVSLEKGEWDAIVEERIWKGDFASLGDFLERMKGRIGEQAVLELIEEGVFDDSGSSRDRLRAMCRASFQGAETAPAPRHAHRAGRAGKRKEASRQISLFDAGETEDPNGEGPGTGAGGGGR